MDDLLRRRLYQAEVPPPAFVWPAVEATLRRRKRRLLVFWLLAIGTAASLALGLWWAFRERSKPAPASPAVAGLVLLPPKTEAVAGGSRSAGTQPQSFAEQKASRYRTQPSIEPSPLRRGAPRQAADAAAAPGILLPQAASAGHSEPAMADTAPKETPAMEMPATENAVFAPNTPRPALQFLPSANLDPLGQTRLISNLKPIALAPIKPKKMPRKCYDFHSNRQAWLVDAYLGPSWTNQRLRPNDLELDDYIHDRQRTERPDWGFNAGVRASYLFGGNFLVRTGLHYDQYMEQFEHIDPNFIQYNIVITQKLINGQWVSVTDTVGVRYGTDYLKTYNRFALLDIPLQAALELRSGPTGVSLNLGGSINVLFHKRGSMLATNGKPVSFTPADEQYDVFRTRVGLSLMGSIQWFYHLSPRTRVFVEPYFRHILKPITRPAYPVEQMQGVGGVRFGATHILNTTN